MVRRATNTTPDRGRLDSSAVKWEAVREPGVTMRAIRLGVFCCLVMLAACSDEGKRPLGASCGAGLDCASGLCFEQECLDPSTSGQGTVGLNTLTSAIWTNWGSRACSELTWMYCIEQ